MAVPSDVKYWTDSGTLLESTIGGSTPGFEQITVISAEPALRRTVDALVVKLSPASASCRMMTLVPGCVTCVPALGFDSAIVKNRSPVTRGSLTSGITTVPRDCPAVKDIVPLVGV